MGALQPWHLIVLLVVVLLVFGAGKLPEVGKSFGKSIKEFKSEISNESKPAETVSTVTTVPPTVVANSSLNGTIPATVVAAAPSEEPEVLIKRTIRTLEDGTQEITEERVTRKKVNS